MTKDLKIEFENEKVLLQGERNSKKLKVDSELVKFLSNVRKEIKETYPNIKGDDRPWHIELNSGGGRGRTLTADTGIDKGEQINTRAQQIHGKTVDVSSTSSYQIMGKAFVLNTPAVDKYGNTHVTVAFFPDGATSTHRTKCDDVIKKLS